MIVAITREEPGGGNVQKGLTVACNCRSIKIQSFDNQTSKFTRPLGNGLAPLRKHVKRRKISNKYGHFVFSSFENQNEL